MESLLTALAMIFSALFVGHLLFTLYPIKALEDCSMLEYRTVAIALGLSLIGMGGLVQAYLGVSAAPYFYLLLLGGLIGFGIFWVSTTFHERLKALSLTDWLLVIPFLGVVLALTRLTLFPDLLVDEYAYHLTAPRAYLNEGRMFLTPHDLHPSFYFLSQMNSYQLLAASPDDVIAPRLLELFRTIIAALGIIGLVGRLYGRSFGLIAGLLVLLNEEVALWGTSAQVDGGQALYVVAALIVTNGIFEKRDQHFSAFLLLGWLIGAIIAVKQAGVFLAGILTFSILICLYIQWKKESFRALPLVLLGGAIIVLPWVLRSYLYTGNPMLPFLRGIFPVNESAAIPAKAFLDFYPKEPRSILSVLFPDWGHLYIIVTNTRPWNTYGIVVLALSALLLRVLSRSRTLQRHPIADASLIVSLLAILALLNTPYPRFLMAAYPIAIVALMGALRQWGSTERRVRQTHIVLTLLIAGALFGFIGLHRTLPRGAERTLLLPPLTIRAAEDYRLRRVAGHQLILRINRTLGSEDRLLMSAPLASTPLLRVRFSPNVPVVTYPTVLQLLADGWSPADIREYLKRDGITHVLMSKIDPTSINSDESFAEHFAVVEEDRTVGVVLYTLR